MQIGIPCDITYERMGSGVKFDANIVTKVSANPRGWKHMLNQITIISEITLVVFVKKHSKLKSILKTISGNIQERSHLVAQFVVIPSDIKPHWLHTSEATKVFDHIVVKYVEKLFANRQH